MNSLVNGRVMGPVLGFRGVKDGRWRTSALFVTRGEAPPPRLTFTVGGTRQNASAPVQLKSVGEHHVWRATWAVPQTAQEQAVEYSVDGGQTAFTYVVPAQDRPLRLAYGSCCGFSSLKDMKKVTEKNAMWQGLDDAHRATPYHLLLLGGDQMYADLIWDVVPPLHDWFNHPLADRVKAPFDGQMSQLVERFYFDLYCERWSQPEPAAVLRQIPSLMMWDDHDIFDGWGSYATDQQQSPVFQGVYAQAREHFRLFQLQAKDDADIAEATLRSTPGFTYAYRIGRVALVALDMRSERTQDQVMSLETWNQVRQWMDDEAQGCDHLLVMSSIPVVYVNANMLEAAFGLLPGQQDLEDDFKDQWLSRTHQEERLRLIHRLLKFSKETRCRVTIVSGDVHVGALGYIQSERDGGAADASSVINQLISSGMVHTPPAGIIVYMMEQVMGDKVEDVDRGITARMLKFPGSPHRFIGARNWLSLTLDEQHRIWAEWYVEGEAHPYTKVIHPVAAIQEPARTT
jgi:PhoD related phosphatase